MKKIFLSFAILVVSLSAFATSFQSNQFAINCIVLQDVYTEIKTDDLPVAITSALKVKYPKAVIEKAYVNADKLYKLDITIGNLRETLLCEENGNWVQ